MGQVAQARAWQRFVAVDLGAYLKGMQRAAASFHRCGDLRHACHALGNVGYAASELGDYARAEVALEDAIAAATRVGIPNAAGYAKHNLGLVLARRGKIGRASCRERG